MRQELAYRRLHCGPLSCRRHGARGAALRLSESDAQPGSDGAAVVVHSIRSRTSQAPPVLDPVRLTPEANAIAARVLPDGGRALLAVNLTLIDTNGVTLGADASVATAELQRTRPDAALLCYAADEPASLVRVVEYWLPLIRDAHAAKPHWPYTPVALCGTKEELFDEGERKELRRRSAHWAPPRRLRRRNSCTHPPTPLPSPYSF